jgi:hypothetical protein
VQEYFHIVVTLNPKYDSENIFYCEHSAIFRSTLESFIRKFRRKTRKRMNGAMAEIFLFLIMSNISVTVNIETYHINRRISECTYTQYSIIQPTVQQSFVGKHRVTRVY